MGRREKVYNAKKTLQTDVSLHPGEIIEMELEARGIRKIDFAADLGMKPSHFSELMHGKRNVGAAVALKLEKLLGIAADNEILYMKCSEKDFILYVCRLNPSPSPS